MRAFRIALVLSLSLSFVSAAPLFAQTSAATPAPQAAGVEKCEHGVKTTLCTRCNPKLETVFKAKGDWCPEHARPESQCSICHPELATQGVK